MSKMRSALAALAAAGVLVGGVAVAMPAQASTETAAEAAVRPGDTCWIKHDQAPVYNGPSLNSGIKEFLDRTNYIRAGASPDLVEVLHTRTGNRIGYMQQSDLDPCFGPQG